MTCQWDPGRETHLETNFTLKSEWQVPLGRSPWAALARRWCWGSRLGDQCVPCKLLTLRLTLVSTCGGRGRVARAPCARRRAWVGGSGPVSAGPTPDCPRGDLRQTPATSLVTLEHTSEGQGHLEKQPELQGRAQTRLRALQRRPHVPSRSVPRLSRRHVGVTRVPVAAETVRELWPVRLGPVSCRPPPLCSLRLPR